MRFPDLWRRLLRPALFVYAAAVLAVSAVATRGAPSLDNALWVYAAIFPLVAIGLGVDWLVSARDRGRRPSPGLAIRAVVAALALSAPISGAVLAAAWGLDAALF